MKYKIGIDPGLTGAIAVLDENDLYLELHDIPTEKRKVAKKMRNHIEICQLLDIFRDLKCRYRDAVWIIERLHASSVNGVTGNFTSGHNFGLICGCLAGLDILDLQLVTPMKWKSHYKLLKQPKDAGRLMAQIRWTNAPLDRKKDHDRADALFIASMGEFSDAVHTSNC